MIAGISSVRFNQSSLLTFMIYRQRSESLGTQQDVIRACSHTEKISICVYSCLNTWNNNMNVVFVCCRSINQTNKSYLVFWERCVCFRFLSSLSVLWHLMKLNCLNVFLTSLWPPADRQPVYVLYGDMRLCNVEQTGLWKWTKVSQRRDVVVTVDGVLCGEVGVFAEGQTEMLLLCVKSESKIGFCPLEDSFTIHKLCLKTTVRCFKWALKANLIWLICTLEASN